MYDCANMFHDAIRKEEEEEEADAEDADAADETKNACIVNGIDEVELIH